MAWEDHPELVSAPGDGYDERTAIMGDMADDLNPITLRRVRRERERAQVDPGRAARLERVMRAREDRTGVFESPPWATEPGAERFGGEPPVGTVLRWTRPTGSVWIAMHTDMGWEIGTLDGLTNWAAVVEHIGDCPCEVAIMWREIPSPEPEPSGDDAVRDWAARFLPDSASQPPTVAPDYISDGAHTLRPHPNWVRTPTGAHCDRCREMGHVAAHPDLGCADVGCTGVHTDRRATDDADAALEDGYDGPVDGSDGTGPTFMRTPPVDVDARTLRGPDGDGH